jgi:hypothetical protein
VTKWILEALRINGRSHERNTSYPVVAGDAATTESLISNSAVEREDPACQKLGTVRRNSADQRVGVPGPQCGKTHLTCCLCGSVKISYDLLVSKSACRGRTISVGLGRTGTKLFVPFECFRQNRITR